MVRALWFSLGVVAFVLGVIGAVLPIMPTAPFMILAAFAFGKCSRRFELWLLNSRAFGPIIADWRRTGAIAPRIKAISTGMMACSILLSLALGVPGRVLAIQAICLAGAATFVLSRPNR